MRLLDPEKLHVKHLTGLGLDSPVTPRRYTLTHSDSTGELFLTIGLEYDRKQVSGWYTSIMRDEVLAEWKVAGDKIALNVYCHVSGGVVFGSAGWRESIFRHELPLVLEAIRYGDRPLFQSNPELDLAPIWVHFKTSKSSGDSAESWGSPKDYM